MFITRIIALTLFLAACASAQASQPIYRCVGANGEVAFVPTPCDEKAEPLRLRGHPPSNAASPAADIAPTAEAVPVGTTRPRLSGEQRMAEEGNIRIREQRCLTAAAERAWVGVTDSVASRRATIARLERETLRARNNLAGATWESGLREQIAAETTAIATEEANARRVQADLERQCRETAAEERRRLNEDD